MEPSIIECSTLAGSGSYSKNNISNNFVQTKKYPKKVNGKTKKIVK
jgi:hypothetical protein